MGKLGRQTFFYLSLPMALVCGALLFSACIQPTTDTTPTRLDEFSDCLPAGQSCGGGKLCCDGSICKGAKCSTDANCIGPGGRCASSGDCCGTAACNNLGVCDNGSCSPIGGACTGSADCCGAAICRPGQNGQSFCQ